MQNTQRPMQPTIQLQNKNFQQRQPQNTQAVSVSIDPNKTYLAQQIPSLSQTERNKNKDNEFKLKRKIEMLHKYMYPAILQHMKRVDRIAFGECILAWICDLHTIANEAEYNKRMRYKLYNEMDIIQKKIRNRLYLAQSVKAIPIKKYEVASEKLVEIGSMLGGLLKSC